MMVLYPLDSTDDLRIWSDLYLRDTRYTPAGSSEHSSSSLANDLHRSTADPTLNDSLRLESSTNSSNHVQNFLRRMSLRKINAKDSNSRQRSIVSNDKCTKAENYSSAMAHFCCSNCKERINGEHYVILESQLICLNCSERNADYCDTCGERIEADQPQKAHESQHWHATDACFYCYTCLIPLNNRGFFSHYGELFCSNKCISQINDPSINTRSRT